MNPSRHDIGDKFTLEQEFEIINYVEERLCDEFTDREFQVELVKIEKLIEDRCEEAKNEMGYQIYQMKKELEEQFNLKSRKSFWKWWK